MFAKLAIRNVHRQIQSYLIYFVTVALSIALLFAVNNLSYSDRIQTLSEIYADIRSMFAMVTVLSCLVTALVLSYATGFMLKLRRREFGMYLTLGMIRKNIQTLFACETGLLTGLHCLLVWEWDWLSSSCWQHYLLPYWRFPSGFLPIPYRGLS